MDTGTRDMILSCGDFVENFNYNKWQQLIKAGSLDAVNILTVTDGEDKLNNNNEQED